MPNAIAATTPNAPAEPLTDAQCLKEIEKGMAQRMMMGMQQGQQAMSKSMTKLTDQIKASVQDEE